MAVQPNEQLSLDSAQENGFLPFYLGLADKPSSTIRFFDRTGYYTVHGEDAIFTAKEVYKTTGVIKYFVKDGQKFEYVCLNKVYFEKWIRELLLVRQYRVEIYQNNGTFKRHDWSLAMKASPGNLEEFEELLFAPGNSSNLMGVMAVKLGHDGDQRVVGIGYVDNSARKFLVSEIIDNEYFSNLENVGGMLWGQSFVVQRSPYLIALLVQLGPSECLIPSGDSSPDYVKIKKIVERSSALVTERKKCEFSSKDIEQDLDRLLKFDMGVESSMHLKEVNKTLSMGSLSALIKFLDLLSETGNLGHFKLRSFDSSQYMRLDTAGVQALNLMPSAGNRNKYQSLFGVLNRCCTMQGQRLLAQWIKQPLVDLNKITERQNLVESFFNDVSLRQQLHDDYLKKVPDYQKFASKFSQKRAKLQDCHRAFQALTKLPQLTGALESHSGQHLALIESYFTSTLNTLSKDFVKFLELIETTVDLNRAEKNEYIIKPEFDDTLCELRQEIDKKLELMDSALQRAAGDLKLEAGKGLKLDLNTQSGYAFRVTFKDEKSVRNNNRYTIIEANKSVGVRFQSSELKATNAEYMSLRKDYEEQQKAVVDEVLGVAAGYADSMLQLGSLLAELDVIVSLAVTAANAPAVYVKPKMLPKASGIIKLSQSRHPCLELQDSLICIPNDANFDQAKRFLIITGPNMGGKSTYLRTIGITTLMAQIGSFVPCESAEISIVDAILTRFGCQDSISFGVSSFMLEMIEMASILRVATSSSLLLIDELGRGTSTFDGFGLAWAICEKIATDIQSYAAVATHFHRLTEMEETVSTVKNLHVTTLIGSDGPTFLYRIKEGTCDRSFGIHLAELVNFPKSALEYAKRKAEELEDFHSCTLEKHPELVGEDQMAVKNRQVLKKEGEAIIASTLRQVKECHEKSANKEEFVDAIEKIKIQVTSANNAYIEDILNRPCD